MKGKKIFKIIGAIIGLVLLSASGLFGYMYYEHQDAYDTENKPYKKYIGYIDQEKAALNDTYELCGDGFIQRTYNGAALEAYAVNKRHFRNQLNKEFSIVKHEDSGYLNFRFLVNCEGKAGWFETIEMNLDLVEQKLNPNLVRELLEFTSNSNHWNILRYPEDNTPYNYYTYISYRIENGKITEIIP